METVKQKCLNFLMENGLWPDQADQVFERAKPKLEVGGYKMLWGRPSSEYPDVLYAVMFLTLKTVGLEWIDENCPQAWFRPMFTASPESEIKQLKEHTK